MDNVSKETRSRIMSKVRSKGNKSTEVRFRAYLVKNGIRGWIVTPENVPGNPDFAFLKEKIAIFIDGCFWHGCPRCCRMPHSRRDYWEGKIRRNVKRDRRMTRKLRNQGWSVLRIWEHDIKDRPASALARLMRIKKNKKTTKRF